MMFWIHSVDITEITDIYSHWKKFRQINYLVNSFGKHVTFTKFLPKKESRGNYDYFLSRICGKNFVKVTVLINK